MPAVMTKPRRSGPWSAVSSPASCDARRRSSVWNFAPDADRRPPRTGADGLAQQLVLLRPRMLAVAKRILRSEEDAQDAVQDAFVSALGSAPEFRQESQASTWLHRIVVNSCLMQLRRRRRRPATSLDAILPFFDDCDRRTRPDGAWSQSTYGRLERIENSRRVRQCIDELPAEYRQILILRDIEERDTCESAKLLEITAGAAKTRLHRARQALRERLERTGVAEEVNCG